MPHTGEGEGGGGRGWEGWEGAGLTLMYPTDPSGHSYHNHCQSQSLSLSLSMSLSQSLSMSLSHVSPLGKIRFSLSTCVAQRRDSPWLSSVVFPIQFFHAPLIPKFSILTAVVPHHIAKFLPDDRHIIMYLQYHTNIPFKSIAHNISTGYILCFIIVILI